MDVGVCDRGLLALPKNRLQSSEFRLRFPPIANTAGDVNLVVPPGIGVTGFSEDGSLSGDAVLPSFTISSTRLIRFRSRKKKNVAASSAMAPRIIPIAIPALAPALSAVEDDAAETPVSDAVEEETNGVAVRREVGADSDLLPVMLPVELPVVVEIDDPVVELLIAVVTVMA